MTLPELWGSWSLPYCKTAAVTAINMSLIVRTLISLLDGLNYLWNSFKQRKVGH